MDTISVSGAIAFIFEAVSKGLVRNPWSKTSRLEWGSGEGVLSLIRQIAEGEGMGSLLQGGVRKAAEKLGPEANEFAIQVKGLEAPYHDPRALVSLALAYATSPRGACHRGCTHNVERVPLRGSDIQSPSTRFEQQGKGKAAALWSRITPSCSTR